MRDRADAGDALGQDDAAPRVQAFESLLHAAVLEKEMRLVVEDVLADVEEGELRRFQHIGAHRAERQSLHVAGTDFRQSARHILVRRRGWARRRGGVAGERRGDAFAQHQPVRLGVVGEPDAVQIHDLALVPAEQRPDMRKARRIAPGIATGIAIGAAAPDRECRDAGARDEIAQLEPAILGGVGIGHLHPAARRQQVARRGFELFDGEHNDFGAVHCAVAETAPPPSACAMLPK